MSLIRRRPAVTVLLVVGLLGPDEPTAGFPIPRPPKSARPSAAVPGFPVHADARVGDWVSYRTTGPDPRTVKRTVTQVRADSVTVREEREDKTPVWEYSLRKDGTAPAPPLKGKDAGQASKVADPPKVEVLGTGKEALSIAGKKYECEWTQTRIAYRLGTGGKSDDVVIVRKRWVSKDVPLDGEVRAESMFDGKPAGGRELTGFGRGPEPQPDRGTKK